MTCGRLHILRKLVIEGNNLGLLKERSFSLFHSNHLPLGDSEHLESSVLSAHIILPVKDLMHPHHVLGVFYNTTFLFMHLYLPTQMLLLFNAS